MCSCHEQILIAVTTLHMIWSSFVYIIVKEQCRFSLSYGVAISLPNTPQEHICNCMHMHCGSVEGTLFIVLNNSAYLLVYLLACNV